MRSVLRHLMAMTTSAAACALGACSSDTVGPPPAPPVNWQSLVVQPSADAGRPAPTASERRVAEIYASVLMSRDEHDAFGAAAAGRDASTSSGPLAALAPHLDEDAHFAFPSWQDVHGRSGVLRAHELLFGPFDHRAFVLSRVWRTPSQQALAWTLTGVQAREWMGVPATNRHVHVSGLTVLTTTDEGTIADVHAYFDAALLKAQLGVGSKELQAVANGTSSGLPPSAPLSLLPADAGVGLDAGAPPELRLGAEARPAGAPQVYDQSGTPEELQAVMLGRASLDALEANHESAYVDTMTDDVEIHGLEQAQPWRGKADARAYFKAMHKAVGQLDTTVLNIQGVQNFAYVEYTIAGEQLGPILSVPAQRDKAIRLHLVDVIEERGGKIARVWRYGNPEEILAPSPE
jgi:predicted ester cyclase